MRYKDIRKILLQKMKEGLSPKLYFHNIDHTKDVIRAVEAIGLKEELSDDEMTLVKTAALFHDAGMIKKYSGHEEEGCKLAREMLPEYDYTVEQIEQICQMIMATMLPNEPEGRLSEILCDADFDYLGRDDYFALANSLYEEFRAYGVVDDERDWNETQKHFLENHAYYTETSLALRESKKIIHLEEVKESIKSYQERD